MHFRGMLAACLEELFKLVPTLVFAAGERRRHLDAMLAARREQPPVREEAEQEEEGQQHGGERDRNELEVEADAEHAREGEWVQADQEERAAHLQQQIAETTCR